MTYKIIGDSCLDLTDGLKKDPRFQMMSLALQVGNALIVDDETFDQKKFIDLIKACLEYPKTARPSPETFKEAYEEADTEGVFMITLSDYLSGNYNSTELARRLFGGERAEKGHGDQGERVTVIDSSSTSSGELNIAVYVQALCEAGLEFGQVLEETLAYRDSMKTYLVLESLDTLRKDGRPSRLRAFSATALNIKSVMGVDSRTIIKLDQAKEINKTTQRMYDITVKEAGNIVDKIAVVCHVNHPQQAEHMKSGLEKRGTFKDIVIITVAGMATVYTNDGGITLAI